MISTIRNILFSALAALFAGWFANRVVSDLHYNPIAIGSSFGDTLLESIKANPLWIDMDHFNVFALVALFVFAALFMVTAGKIERNDAKGEEFGSSRWATVDEIQGFKSDTYDENFLLSEHSAISIPRIGNSKSLINKILPFTYKPVSDRNKHILVEGGSGSGKGYNVIGPNILQARYSMLITDPKGDMLAKYGNYLIGKGYKIKVVNVKDPASFYLSLHYNPLRYITSQASIMSLVNIIIENTEGEGKDKGEDFFVKAERCLYMCLIAYLYYYYMDEPEHCTIPAMLDLLEAAQASEVDEEAVSGLDIIIEDFKESLIDKYGSAGKAKRSEEWFVITQYNGYKKAAGETAKSVLISCFVRLAPFAIDSVRDMFSSDELELGLVGEEKTAMFLIMSDTDKTFNFILAMLLYQFFDINTNVADKNPGSHCTIPIMCLLDELANIGTVPDLDVKIATLRSRWINLVLFVQNISQLEKCYTKEGSKIIAGNCDTTLFLGRSDADTNEEISKRLGKETIRYTTNSYSSKGGKTTTENLREHPLLSAEDLGNNPDKFADDECLVLIKNFMPFKDKKFFPQQHPSYEEFTACAPFDAENHILEIRAENYRREQREAQAARESAADVVRSYMALFENVVQTIRI